jgi:putative FmdB family regulatory protein
MPTYEYRCLSCRHTFERVQRMTDKPVSRCPKCGKRVEKVFHAVPILFSGPGFHINDYAPDKTRPKPAEASTPESKPAKASGSESKPGKEPAKPSPTTGSKE